MTDRGSLETLVRSSGFIFSGTVVRTGAVTMDAVPVSDDTAVVMVDEVLLAPDAFGERKGSMVTVRLRTPAQKMEKRIFFTVVWMSGESLALREIGHQEAKDVPGLLKDIRESLDRMEEREFEHRVAASEAIVAGKVVRVGPIAEPEPIPTSEHDPFWRMATVSVDSVVKGTVRRGGEVEVAYAASGDVMWARAPKLSEGQDAVFLLHREVLEPMGITVLAVPEPGDVKPRRELASIQQVVGRLGSPPSRS